MRAIDLTLLVLACTLHRRTQARFLGQRDVSEDDISPGYGDPGNETSFSEPDDATHLCERSGRSSSCSGPTVRPAWYNRLGEPISWFVLNDENKKGFWDEATATGATLKETLDDYVGRKQSRLKEQFSNQDELFRDGYVRAPPELYQVTALQAGSSSASGTKVFKLAGINDVNLSVGFTLFKYLSKAKPQTDYLDALGAAAVMAMATNPQKATIVSTWSYSKFDYNPPKKRAYSSTLTWNAWKDEANQAGISPGVLKYQLRHTITGKLATNIMALAHVYYPDAVQIFNDRYGKPLPAQAGQGRWTPDHPAFKTLLTIPNLRTTVNMLIDYNDEMHSPYIAVIHTVPPVGCYGKKEGVRFEGCRQGEILIEFGPAPAGISNQTTPSSGSQSSASASNSPPQTS